MKKIFYIFLAAVMVLAVSCKKDNFNYGRGDKDNTGVLTMTAPVMASV